MKPTNEESMFDAAYQASFRQLPEVPKQIRGPKDCRLNYLTDKAIDEDKQWKLMMDYFTKNPQALMDAIPTPPGEEEDEFALLDFQSGLTPKKSFKFKFGHIDPSGALDTSFNFRPEIPKRPQSTTLTPRKQWNSPRATSTSAFGRRPDSARSRGSNSSSRQKVLADRYGIRKSPLSISSKGKRGEKRDFRIKQGSTGARANMVPRLQQKKEAMEKEQADRKQKTDQLKTKLSGKEPPYRTMSNMRTNIKSETESASHSSVSRAIPAKNTVSIDIDWKRSMFFKYVSGEAEDKNNWYSNEEYLNPEEIEQLLRLIERFKHKKTLFANDELNLQQNKAVKKAYKTIDLLNREIL